MKKRNDHVMNILSGENMYSYILYPQEIKWLSKWVNATKGSFSGLLLHYLVKPLNLQVMVSPHEGGLLPVFPEVIPISDFTFFAIVFSYSLNSLHVDAPCCMYFIILHIFIVIIFAVLDSPKQLGKLE